MKNILIGAAYIYTFDLLFLLSFRVHDAVLMTVIWYSLFLLAVLMFVAVFFGNAKRWRKAFVISFLICLTQNAMAYLQSAFMWFFIEEKSFGFLPGFYRVAFERFGIVIYLYTILIIGITFCIPAGVVGITHLLRHRPSDK